MTPVEKNVKPKKAAMTPEQRRQRQFLLSQLVYEMDDEKPVYYAGYRDVLSGIKESEEIMGASGLQSYLVEIVQRFLFSHPFNTRLRIMASVA